MRLHGGDRFTHSTHRYSASPVASGREALYDSLPLFLYLVIFVPPFLKPTDSFFLRLQSRQSFLKSVYFLSILSESNLASSWDQRENSGSACRLDQAGLGDSIKPQRDFCWENSRQCDKKEMIIVFPWTSTMYHELHHFWSGNWGPMTLNNFFSANLNKEEPDWKQLFLILEHQLFHISPQIFTLLSYIYIYDSNSLSIFRLKSVAHPHTPTS